MWAGSQALPVCDLVLVDPTDVLNSAPPLRTSTFCTPPPFFPTLTSPQRRKHLSSRAGSRPQKPASSRVHPGNLIPLAKLSTFVRISPTSRIRSIMRTKLIRRPQLRPPRAVLPVSSEAALVALCLDCFFLIYLVHQLRYLLYEVVGFPMAIVARDRFRPISCLLLALQRLCRFPNPGMTPCSRCLEDFAHIFPTEGSSKSFHGCLG